MTEEQRIHKIAEKRVKEWIEYAKKVYGWENAQYDLFEEPMFELCVQVATLATKELQKENKTVSRKANEAIADKLLITAKYNEVLNDLNQENDKLQKKNSELEKQNKELQEELESSKRDNEILWERLKKYKEDLKKLRIAFIQAQAMAIGGKSIEDIIKEITKE